MVRNLTLAAGLLAAGVLLAPNLASAAPGTPQSAIGTTEAASTLLQKAGWGWGHRRRCHRWRHECAHRWGWGGWRYRRCLWRHGC